MEKLNQTVNYDLNVVKRQSFLQKLKEVELKNIDWFKSRPAIFDHHQHDSINNHFFSDLDGEVFSFNFWKYSELPEKIKVECLSAYEEIFGKKAVA